MPPISPMKDGATGKTVKSATLTPLRTLELNEVYQLITAGKSSVSCPLKPSDSAPLC